MEKTIIQEKTPLINEKLNLINRNKFTLEGAIEVISSSENGLFLKVKDTHMSITGSDIHIEKLDIDNKILECSGSFECIKYGKSGNFFKRIFKWKYLMHYN